MFSIENRKREGNSSTFSRDDDGDGDDLLASFNYTSTTLLNTNFNPESLTFGSDRQLNPVNRDTSGRRT